MRILMITHPLPTITQPNTMAPVARQIESLRDMGAQVDVLEIKGIPKLKFIQAFPSMRTFAQSADIVHAHYGHCGWLGRLQFRKPLVVSFMGSDLLGTPTINGYIKPIKRLERSINRWFAHTVDAIIVKSAEMAEAAMPVKAHVVPNGVDVNAFKPMDPQKARAFLGWSQSHRYILFPGNPATPRKAFPLARAAVTLASEKMDDSLKLMALDRVEPDKVPFYMNACDAMLMTSYIEGSPNVVKEAMACNLPVVSVPVGDVAELLDGVPGYKICPRNVKVLAETLISTLLDAQIVEGRSALKRKGLDLENVARELIRIYSDVLASNRK